MNNNTNRISKLLNLEALFAKYGIDRLPDDRKKEIESKMTDIFEKRLALRIMDMLNEEQRKKAENIKQDELYEFLEKEYIDFGSVATAEASEFGGELVEYLTYLKGLIDGKSSSS
jgi:RAB protein geranylgeranyltransferase component A